MIKDNTNEVVMVINSQMIRYYTVVYVVEGNHKVPNDAWASEHMPIRKENLCQESNHSIHGT